MKELNVVYQNADYTIRYEYKESWKFSRFLRGYLGNADYTVFFDDESLKKQFGEPFDFFTYKYPNFQIVTYDKSESAKQMADIIIKAIAKANFL